jgi:hypothetical protein
VRGIGADRSWREVGARDWSDWDELQAWTDERVEHEARARTCPATGTSVWAAWQEEQRFLAALPLLPEPFNLVATRTVAADCTVAFEARRCSVPFARMGKVVASEEPKLKGFRETVEQVELLRTIWLRRQLPDWPVRRQELPGLIASCRAAVNLLSTSPLAKR